eukprot:335952-Pelagomonas_calceolata.AAC.1
MATQITVLVLGGLKLILGPDVYTVFDFHKVDDPSGTGRYSVSSPFVLQPSKLVSAYICKASNTYSAKCLKPTQQFTKFLCLCTMPQVRANLQFVAFSPSSNSEVYHV